MAISSLVREETAFAAETAFDASSDSAPSWHVPDAGQSLRDIVVFGRRDDGSIDGVSPQDELGEAEIGAYGLDNVGQVLDELAANVRNGDTPPVILINGYEASSLADVADLPAEALKKVQLLPPDTAVRFGHPKTRPVINVVLKTRFRQYTMLGEFGQATAGGGRRANGEFGWTTIAGADRNNITLKLHGADPLFEDERDIVREVESGSLMSFSGIVLPRPLFGLEIDPALSALAGEPVRNAGVPEGVASPTLADFARTANRATPSDIGRFHTLLPRKRGLALNASFARRLSPRLTAQFHIRGDYTTAQDRNGTSEALLALPASSPFSPFSRGVTIGRYLGEPLEQRNRSGSFNLGGSLARQAGAWRLALTADWVHAESRSHTERGLDMGGVQAGLDNGTINPFAPLPPELLTTMAMDRARGRRDRLTSTFTLNGPLFSLPAGAVVASARLSGVHETSRSRSAIGPHRSDRRNQRDEALGIAGLEMPLLAKGTPLGWPLGSLSLTLNASARAISNARTYTGHGYGLRWSPFAALDLQGGFDSEQVPPALNLLTDPLVVRDNQRVFDFLRDETVEVRYVTGGNPRLATERRRTLSLGGTLTLAPRGGFIVTANWSRVRGRNAQGTLPPASAEVQAAFADRYQRDATGRLVEVDARAISFARVEREAFTWGVSLRQHLGGGSAGDGTDESDGGTARVGLRKGAGGVRLSASLRHTWTLRATRQARAALPVVDLLNGGALGYGGGQAKHQIEFATGITGGGLGLQVKGSHTGPSAIRAGAIPRPSDLRFAARGEVEARLFAELGQLLPASPLAKGMRLSLVFENLFDSQLTVRDRDGATPLSYQRWLSDPLGRTVTIGLRKKL
ncbi:MAG: hypothetical protein WCY11_12160 [Novosphingobium sp.]